MRFKKILILLVLLLVLPILSGCSTAADYDYSIKRVKAIKVQEEKIRDNLVFSGNLEGNKETIVASKIGGQIKSMDVFIGDIFQKGQVLASLTGEENYTNRNTAWNSYQNSLANVDNVKYLMEEKVKSAEVALKTSQENLEAIKLADKNEDNVSIDQIKKVELNLEMLQINLDNLESNISQKEQDIVDNILSGMRQSVTLAGDALAYVYSINNKSLPDDNNSFRVDNDFVVKNEKNKTSVEEKVRKMKNSYYEFKDYFEININGLDLTTEEVLIARDKTEEMLRVVSDALGSVSVMVTDSVAHSGMNRTVLDGYRSGVVGYSTQIENMLLSQDSGIAIGLMGARQALDNLKIEKENNERELHKQIEITENQLSLLRGTVKSGKDDLSSRVSIAEFQVRQAEVALEAAKKSSDSQIQIVKTQVDISKGSLNMANVNVENTKLKAPYNGVVVERFIEEGSVINAGTPIFKIADMSSLKMIVFIPERDVRKIKIGDMATATVDSLSDEEFSAKVERISPKTEESTKKVRVELSIKKHNDLKIGMYMVVDFNKTESKKALVVPSKAIIKNNNINQVMVVIDSKIKVKDIEIGVSMGENVEIINGLTIDETVVVSSQDGLQDGDTVEVLQG